jgi:hypothetical protein
LSAPHATLRREHTPLFDVSIGRLSFRLQTTDESLLQAAKARYASFAGQELEASFVFFEEEPPEEPGSCEFGYEFEGARLRALERESRMSGVRNEYALDSLLRVLLSWKLLSCEGFLLHAATVVRNGKAFVFTGRSGAGKSTVASLSPEGSVLTDEISLLRRENGAWRAYGTPFWGEFRAAGSNTSAPVAGIFRLLQASENLVIPLSKREILRMLLANVLFFSGEHSANQQLLNILSCAAEEIFCGSLSFRKDPAFWEVLPA